LIWSRSRVSISIWFLTVEKFLTFSKSWSWHSKNIEWNQNLCWEDQHHIQTWKCWLRLINQAKPGSYGTPQQFFSILIKKKSICLISWSRFLNLAKSCLVSTILTKLRPDLVSIEKALNIKILIDTIWNRVSTAKKLLTISKSS
jgi:hypothetical protein